MGSLLLLLWPFSVLALGINAAWTLQDISDENNPDRRARLKTAVALAIAPPAAVFLIAMFVLLQAAPTVQFNVGSSRALDLWSFWVHWYPTIFFCSALQTACYAAWFLGTLATRTLASVRSLVGVGLLSSLCGTLLLSMAYPTA
jgi:hypothetical protein